MLQQFREKIQGWVAWLIVSIIAIPFALFGINYYVGTGKHHAIAATVNGVEISANDVSEVYAQLKNSQMAMFGNNYVPSTDNETNLKKQALQQLIDTQLSYQGAVQKGYRVTPDQVLTLVASQPQFQENNQFSQTRFEMYLRRQGLNVNSFLATQSANLLIDQVRLVYLASAFALPNEVSDFIQLKYQSRSIGYFVLHATDFLNKVSVTAADEKKYYDQNQAAFMSPQQVKIDYLVLSIPEFSKNVVVSDKEINAYYNNNIDNFTDPGSWHIAQILIQIPPQATKEQIEQAKKQADDVEAQIKAGKNFADLAKQYSQDASSKQQGGDIGWINANTLGKEFQAAVNSLKQKGDVSSPVLTQYGYNIIKLIDSKPAVTKPLSQVSDQIQQILKDQKARQQFADANDKLTELTYSNSDSLLPASKSLNLPIQTSAFFSKAGGNDTITKSPKIIDAAFRESVLTQGYNSDPIQVGDDKIVVLRLNKSIPAAVKPYAEVESQIHTILGLQEAKNLAKAAGSTLLKQLSDNPGQANSAVTWVAIQDLLRNDQRVAMDIINHAFQIVKSTDAKTDPVTGFVMNNGDYVLLTLHGIKPGAPADMALETKQANTEIELRYGWTDYFDYMASLKDKAKIELMMNP